MDISSKKKQANSSEIKKPIVFSEWIDAEFNTEKWDLKLSKEGRRDSRVSPVSLYQDPDGFVVLPRSFKVAYWKRISQLFIDDEKEPVITPEDESDFDFLQPNRHLFVSEFMRNLISQLIGLYDLNKTRPIVPEPVGTVFMPTESTPWKPWHHIYCNCKAGKIPHNPIYSNNGKYIVRLYLLGCWRKIYVDDLIPFDAENHILLPTTANKYEIWPLILFKAFLKLGYAQLLNYSSTEMGFFCIIPSLTTWQPEYRKIFKGFPQDTWNALIRCLPKYKIVDDKLLGIIEERKPKSTIKRKFSQRTSKANLRISESAPIEIELNDITDLIYNPHLIMCVVAVIRKDKLLPAPKKELKEIDAILRHYDLCYSLATTVFLNQIRDCPLEPSLQAEDIPKYKLIRRHLWDPSYSRTRRIKSPDIQSIHILPSGHWLKYRPEKKFDPKEKELIIQRNRKSVSTVLHMLEGLIYNTVKEELEGTKPPPSQIPLVEQSFQSTVEERNFWIDLLEFCKCFGSIIIFHNTSAYNYYYKVVDPRLITPEGPFTIDKRQQKDTTNLQIVPLQPKVSKYLLADYPFPKILFLSFVSIRDINPETSENEEEPTGKKLKRSSVKILAEEFDFEFNISTLQLEEYFFKTMMHSYVLLNLNPPFGIGIRVPLPKGRTVLRVTANATNPGILHLWSSTPFLYGDEELILSKLTTESMRFTIASCNIFNQLIECLGCYDNPNEFRISMLRLRGLLFPANVSENHTKAQLTTIFNTAFYSLMERIVDRCLNPDMFFTIRCITLDATTTRLFKKINYSDVKQAYRKLSENQGQTRKLRKKSSSKGTLTQDHYASPAASPQSYSHVNISKTVIYIQSLARRLIAQRMVESRIDESKYNIHVSSNILKIISELEKNAEEYSNYFLRTLMEISPSCVSKFPFYQDEKQRISYNEFRGVIPSLAPYSWILVFREVFYCKENVELVPRLYIDNCNCQLNITIINNDNLEITPVLFLQPQHFLYVPNNSGYTIMIEATSKDKAVLDCEWKLRIIKDPSAKVHYGSQDIIGSPTFSMKEIAEYYVPNKHNLVARFNIKCFADSLITLQYLASNPNVVFIANLYKNDELIKAICKKGIIVFPAVLMRENEQGNRVNENARSNEDINKLCLEILVKRDSWLLSIEDSFFLMNLQLKERTEMNVFDYLTAEDTDTLSAYSSGSQPSPQKKRKSKVINEKMNESIDFSKPHYVVRVIVDASAMDFIEVKKDVGYLEEFRMLKRAWEEAAPGRALRALAERRSFLQKFLDLPPPEDDPLEYRRAIDYRLLNDIRNERFKNSLTSESMQSSKNLTFISSQQAYILPPSPITIIPLKPLNIEQFLRRSELQTLERYFLEDQQEAIDNYKQQQKRKIFRRQQTADIRKMEKIVLIEKSEFLLKSRPLPFQLCGAHSMQQLSTLSYSTFEQKYSTKTRHVKQKAFSFIVNNP